MYAYLVDLDQSTLVVDADLAFSDARYVNLDVVSTFQVGSWAAVVRSEGKELPLLISENREKVLSHARWNTKIFVRRATEQDVALFRAQWYQDLLDIVHRKTLAH